ncbi:MAG: glycosyltransferase family 4 protein [bacterium]
MRVLHLNHYGSMKGGVQGYIADVVMGLEMAGHQSRLMYFAPDDPGDPVANGTHAFLPQWPSSPAQAVQAIEQVIAGWCPDVAYVHQVDHPGLVRWIASRLPTVAYVHGPYPVCPGSAQYLRRSERVCPHRSGAICLVKAQTERCCWGHNPVRHLRKLAKVRAFLNAYQEIPSILVASCYMKELLQRNGVPASRISVLAPFLVDQDGLAPASRPHNGNTVLFAGRLVPEKGLHHLIRSLSQVRSEWQLLVAGDGPERESYHSLANQLGVVDSTHFLGWLDHAEMRRVIRESACVAVPSLWPEPFGRIGPEAFLEGRPVVAFDVGGIRDWLEHRKTGYLVGPGDVHGLSESLRSLLTSPELCSRMGRYARRKAVSAWDRSRHTEALLDAFAIRQ